MGPGGDVNKIDFRLNKNLRGQRRLRQSKTARLQIVTVYANRQQGADPDLRPHCLHNFPYESTSPRKVAAVRVLSTIGSGGEKGAEKKAVTPVDLDHVEAGLAGPLCSLHEGLNDIVNLSDGQRAGLRENVSDRFRGRDSRLGNHSRLRAAVTKLDAYGRLRIAEQAGQSSEPGDKLIALAPELTRKRPARDGIHARKFGHHQTRATGRVLGIVGQERLRYRSIGFAQFGGKRRANDSIRKAEASDRQRREQARII